MKRIRCEEGDMMKKKDNRSVKVSRADSYLYHHLPQRPINLRGERQPSRVFTEPITFSITGGRGGATERNGDSRW